MPKDNKAETSALLEKCRAGDEAAWFELIDKHRGIVNGICFSFFKNTDDMLDAAQDTWLLVHRKLAQFRGESLFTTWLYRVAVSSCLMRLRKVRREAGDLSLDALLGDPKLRRHLTAHDTQLSNVTARHDIALILDQLPSGYRKAIIWHDLAEMEHREIVRLGAATSVGCSKSQNRNARKVMRKFFESGVKEKKI